MRQAGSEERAPGGRRTKRWCFDGLAVHETVHVADEGELHHGGSWVLGHLQRSSLA